MKEVLGKLDDRQGEFMSDEMGKYLPEDHPLHVPEAKPAPEMQLAEDDGSGQPQLDTKEGTSLSEEEQQRLTDGIVAALKTVYDPEIPTDIYELGLIYKVDLTDDRDLDVDMTLTAPGCPVAGEMPIWVENALLSVPGVGQVTVNMVFDPPWTPERMSEEAKVALNWF